jgi:hypothetical protein
VVAVLLALSESWLFGLELRVGYFAWVGSMGLVALAGLCAEERRRRPAPWPASRPAVEEASRIAARFRLGRARPWRAVPEEPHSHPSGTGFSRDGSGAHAAR